MIKHEARVNDSDQSRPPQTIEQVRVERIARCTALWSKILGHLQEPVRRTEYDITGYTGHRTVQFEDMDDSYALSFQLHTARIGAASISERAITAYWRRIYPEDVRLVDYESGECSLSIEDPRRHPHLIERFEYLYELFEHGQ